MNDNECITLCLSSANYLTCFILEKEELIKDKHRYRVFTISISIKIISLCSKNLLMISKCH